MRKKVWSALLALTMALSLLPGMAFSEELEAAPFEEAQAVEAEGAGEWEEANLSGNAEETEEANLSGNAEETEEADVSGDAEEAELSAEDGEPVGLRVVWPDNQTVTQGSSIDISGLEVYAAYEGGTEQPLSVADYSLSGFDSSEPGNKTVTVTYGSLTATFSVTVEAAPEEDYITGIAIFNKSKLKRNYAQGEPLDMDTINALDVTVYHHLREANETVKGSQCAVTGYNPNQLGVQTVTVSYGGKYTEILVKVLPPSNPDNPDTPDNPDNPDTPDNPNNAPTLMTPRINIESVKGGKKVRFTRNGNDDTDTRYHPDNTTWETAKIYYTLDGSAPTPGAEGTVEYDGGDIFLEDTTTVKAIAKLGEESSSVASGRVTVPQVLTPITANVNHRPNQGPDGSMTRLNPGALVSFLCDTAGASIYYWFEGYDMSAENSKYGSSVYIDRVYANSDGVVTLCAYATKDGYKNSDWLELEYQLPPQEAPKDEVVNVAVGTVRSRAGESLSASLSITTQESSYVTGFDIIVRYDRRTFNFVSVSPVETGGEDAEAVIPSGNLFFAPDAANGLVRIMYNGAGVIGGEMCMLNFRAYDDAEDKSYALDVDDESAQVSTSNGSNVREETYDGTITLEGSHNSQLTAAVVFSDENHQDAPNVDALSDSSNVTASIAIDQESAQDYADSLRDESGNLPLTVVANAFIAFYDGDGNMLSLETWEMDLSNLALLLCDRMMSMPEKAQEIKTMVLSESLTPIMAADEL